MGAADSKLAFRRGVFRLFEERNIPASEIYWIQFWSLPETAEDVFTLISASDIRQVRDKAPENLETLILALTSRLFALRHHPSFPDNELAPAQEALNCMRVLTRLFPFLFEVDDLREWQDRFWWTKRRKRPRGLVQGAVKIRQTGEAGAEEGEDEEVLFEGAGVNEGDIPLVQAPISRVESDEGMERSKPLAEELLDTVLDFLSFAGFTIPSTYNQSPDAPRVTLAIWETGVGCNTPVGTSKPLESNKIETLRLLLSMLSSPIYSPGDQLLKRPSPFTASLISSPDKKLVLSLLCSLLNTAMKYNPAGWHLPYEHYVISDPKRLLVTYSLQALLVLLTHDIQPDSATPTTTSKNMYRFYLGKLHRLDDFQFVVDGINRLLSLPIQSNASVLPGSQRTTKTHSEAMVLFWEVWKCNKRFRSFILGNERSLDFLIVLLYYPLEHKGDPSQIGIVRMSAFLLQTLSAEDGFAASLNRPFEGHSALPSSVRLHNFNGTYADFMITSIYNLIATSKGNLTSLYPTFLRTMANVSPHLKNLSTTTSSKLISLFNSMSSPQFLLAKESNPALLHILLESITNIIEHQHSQNPILLYAIIRNHSKFEALQNFDLKAAIAALEERRKVTDEKDSPQPEPKPSTEITSPTSPSTPATAFSVGGEEEEEEEEELAEIRPLSEKARGKLPEGVELPRRESALSIRSASGILTPAAGESKDFRPTEAWVATWLPYLPMMSIMQVIHQLEPAISSLLSSLPTPSSRPVLEHLHSAEISGMEPSPVRTEPFNWTAPAIVWYKSFLWGQIFSSEMDLQNGTVGVWKDTEVRLFKVQQNRLDEGIRGMARDMSAHTVDKMARGVLERLGNVNLGKREAPRSSN